MTHSISGTFAIELMYQLLYFGINAEKQVISLLVSAFRASVWLASSLYTMDKAAVHTHACLCNLMKKLKGGRKLEEPE